MTLCADPREEIRSLVLQKNYPCVAAVQAALKDDLIVKTYDEFGSANHWEALRDDLISFIETQRTTDSKYLSFWAVFSAQAGCPDSEEEFEKKLWTELSYLSSEEQREKDWGPLNTTDPKNSSFCLSLNREKLFVVGLHPRSSRQSRKFSRPALVFNTFSQFKKFQDDGTYDALVKSIRLRDQKFQGTVNPMVLAHGEHWESIQFSGKENPQSWKCPFHFFKNGDKPH